MITFDIPVRTESINVSFGRNARWHVQTLKNQQKLATEFATTRTPGWKPPALPATVTLTRIAPGELDDDNLRPALKTIRDSIAQAIGIDDRDPRVTWAYGQQRGKRGVYRVRVSIEPREDAT